MGTPRPEIAAIIARYCLLLEELGIHVEQAILYGSHARGEARDGSDIDVLVISAVDAGGGVISVPGTTKLFPQLRHD
jgi:predicted nucleotidyltransferase